MGSGNPYRQPQGHWSSVSWGEEARPEPPAPGLTGTLLDRLLRDAHDAGRVEGLREANAAAAAELAEKLPQAWDEGYEAGRDHALGRMEVNVLQPARGWLRDIERVLEAPKSTIAKDRERIGFAAGRLRALLDRAAGS